MRLHIKLSRNTEAIPFDYQKKLTGCIHKWMGEKNEEHGFVSLYSFSWLKGVTAVENGLNLHRDSYLFLSLYENILAKKLVQGIIDNADMFCGVMVREVLIQETPQFDEQEKFFAASPILIKRKLEDGREKHFSYEEENTDDLMTETLQTKLRSAGLPDGGVRVRFDRTYPGAKTKLVGYGKIKNKANICPVIINGSPEQIGFAWDVGIGNSTGVGFGSIEKF